jgi:hypothetical protein
MTFALTASLLSAVAVASAANPTVALREQVKGRPAVLMPRMALGTGGYGGSCYRTMESQASVALPPPLPMSLRLLLSPFRR